MMARNEGETLKITYDHADRATKRLKIALMSVLERSSKTG